MTRRRTPPSPLGRALADLSAELAVEGAGAALRGGRVVASALAPAGAAEGGGAAGQLAAEAAGQLAAEAGGHGAVEAAGAFAGGALEAAGAAAHAAGELVGGAAELAAEAAGAVVGAVVEVISS